ncbi:hypothetical protein NDU88_002755, partial [Pleurodeles waltl]
ENNILDGSLHLVCPGGTLSPRTPWCYLLFGGYFSNADAIKHATHRQQLLPPSRPSWWDSMSQDSLVRPAVWGLLQQRGRYKALRAPPLRGTHVCSVWAKHGPRAGPSSPVRACLRLGWASPLSP